MDVFLFRDETICFPIRSARSCMKKPPSRAHRSVNSLWKHAEHRVRTCIASSFRHIHDQISI